MSEEQSSRRKTDFDDLQAELAGAPNGKQQRFLDGDNAPRARKEAEKKNTVAEAILRNELQKRLDDPAYAAAWNRVNEALDNLQNKITALADPLAQRIEHLEDVIADLEENTAKTANGALVFCDDQGRLVDADGKPLSAEDAATVQNPEDAQSYDQYKNTQEALHKARTKQDRLAEIQQDVTDWKDQVNDPDNPPNKDELDDIANQLDRSENEINAMTKSSPAFNSMSASASSDLIHTSEFQIDMPKF